LLTRKTILFLMNICITRSQKSPYSETFIRNQIKGLAEYGKIFPLYGGRLPEKEESGRRLSPPLFWALHKIVKPLAGRNNYFGHYGLSGFLKTNKIDVVLSNYGFSAAHIFPVCRAARIPMVVHFHGHDATNKRVLAQYEKRYKELFKYASGIIAVSHDMRNRLISLGAEETKVHNIPCGINPTLFRPSKNRVVTPMFLSVGRFVPKKNPRATIMAFQKVWQQYPEARLIMVGGKNKLSDACQSLVRTWGMTHAVSFPGVLPPSEVIAIMQKSYAFLQHSVTPDSGDMEGTPNSILEASACGLPVVSTRHGGISDAVIDGKTGFLVAEGDIEGMSQHMCTLLQNPVLALNMGNAGRDHIILNYALDDQIEKLFHIIKSAVCE
jgi:glycosyltransferase involved in cell wall biosynthesis